jgi:hypothetical protein
VPFDCTRLSASSSATTAGRSVLLPQIITGVPAIR